MGAADFVDRLIEGALAHEAVQHRCPIRFGAGKYAQRSLEFARNYGRWYHGYSAWFPQYLKAVIAGLEDAEHRKKLAANLGEEQGHLRDEDIEALRAIGIDPESVSGVPHPQLFLRFCKATGLTDHDLSDLPAPTIEWRSAFRALLRAGSSAYAVGALGLGTEAIVSTAYEPIIRGLQLVPEISRADIVFFELHCHVDDQHYDDLRSISIDFAATRSGRVDLERGMRDALALRLSFWNAFEQSMAFDHLGPDPATEASRV